VKTDAPFGFQNTFCVEQSEILISESFAWVLVLFYAICNGQRDCGHFGDFMSNLILF